MAKWWALAVMFLASFSSSQNAVVSRIVPFDVIGGISKQWLKQNKTKSWNDVAQK